jgi:hypothetical protein
MTMTRKLYNGPRKVKTAFFANAHLRAPRWRFYSLHEFLRAQFPEPDFKADKFSGPGTPDIFVIKPNLARRGQFLIITPLNTAALLQLGELHRVRADRIHFCVCQPDSITGDDMQTIIAVARDFNGLQIDLAVLTPEERAGCRAMPIQSVNVGPFLDAVEAGKKKEQWQ